MVCVTRAVRYQLCDIPRHHSACVFFVCVVLRCCAQKRPAERGRSFQPRPTGRAAGGFMKRAGSSIGSRSMLPHARSPAFVDHPAFRAGDSFSSLNCSSSVDPSRATVATSWPAAIRSRRGNLRKSTKKRFVLNYPSGKAGPCLPMRSWRPGAGK